MQKAEHGTGLQENAHGFREKILNGEMVVKMSVGQQDNLLLGGDGQLDVVAGFAAAPENGEEVLPGLQIFSCVGKGSQNGPEIVGASRSVWRDGYVVKGVPKMELAFGWAGRCRNLHDAIRVDLKVVEAQKGVFSARYGQCPQGRKI